MMLFVSKLFKGFLFHILEKFTIDTSQNKTFQNLPYEHLHMIILRIPNETLQNWIFPNLQLDDIISFISSSKQCYHSFMLVMKNEEYNTNMCSGKIAIDDNRQNESEQSSCSTTIKKILPFCDQFWKNLCQKRWRSVNFDDVPTVKMNTPPQTEISNGQRSKWFYEYKKRHLADMTVRKNIREIIEFEDEKDKIKSMTYASEESKDKLYYVKSRQIYCWCHLIRNGINSIDFIVELARKNLDEYESLKVPSTQIDLYIPRYRHSFQRLLVVSVLEAVHRFQICRKLRNMIESEQRLGDYCEVAIESGAILFAEYYQNAKEIISEYDNISQLHRKESSLTIKQYIHQEIDKMANYIKYKLKKRLAREEGYDKNKQDGQWPMHMILEEMKVLFQPQEQFLKKSYETGIDCMDMSKSSILVDTRPFAGNEEDYYSYNNSLLDKVLQSRKGIPITLAIVYAAIVRRISNMKMEAAGLPGHFMLSTTINFCPTQQKKSLKQKVFVDVFHGGKILTKEQCQQLICTRYEIQWSDSYTKSISNSDVWRRMLRNLNNCYERLYFNSSTFSSFDCKMFLAWHVLNVLAFETTSTQLNNGMSDRILQAIFKMKPTAFDEES